MTRLVRTTVVASIITILFAMLSMAQMRIDGFAGGPVSRPILFSDGTAAAPSRSYSGDTNLGSYRIGADNEGFTAGGVLRWDYNTARLNLSSGYGLIFNGTSGLFPFTANRVIQRNGTNGQILAVARTWTDDDNNERMALDFEGTTARLTTRADGTGTLRAFQWGTGSAGQWGVDTAGHLYATTDNVNDIGAAGATRPRTGYFGTSIVPPLLNATGASGYQLNGVLVMSATDPTISGGCTAPAVSAANGTAAFRVTIGTSCTGIRTFTLTMPAASEFWSCHGENHTSDAQQQTNYLVGRATSTTAVVMTSYDRVTGLLEDFVASDQYLIHCSSE